MLHYREFLDIAFNHMAATWHQGTIGLKRLNQGYNRTDIIDGRRNVYLFNGDFVDRGGSGYQVIFMLCLFVLVCPGCVYLNRGNHETEAFALAMSNE